MATTVNELRNWFDNRPQNATHMIIVCDTFDYEDFPIYVTGTADEVRDMVYEANGMNMQKVMEVYNFSVDRDEQLSRFRCWEY